MEAKKPKKIGAPTIYKPEYCQAVIDHMSQGLSFETFGASIGVDRSITYEWAHRHPEFAEAKKRAFDLCQIFWEKVGIEGVWSDARGKNLNTGVWVFNMKNRFRWTDRMEVSGDEAKPIMLGYNPKDLDKK
jgi:hypothetical protein